MDLINLIEKALTVRASYHKVISGNIANVETPGYKEKDIDFKKELDRKIRSDAAREGDITITETPVNDGLASIDGNTVSMENQIVKLTENQVMYETLVQVAAKKFSMIQYIISEGKR